MDYPPGGLTIVEIYILLVIKNLEFWLSQQRFDLPPRSGFIKAAAQQLSSSLSVLIFDYADVFCHRGPEEHCGIAS